MADNNEGFLGGLAQGIQQGSNMGYLAMQARAMRENQMRQAQIMEMEQQKVMFERKNAALERSVSIFKELPKSLRQGFFKNNLSPMFKEVYGVEMSPDFYSEGVERGIEDFGKLVKLKREGKLTQDEFMMQAAEIRSMVSKEESAQIGDIMKSMPGTKAQPKEGFAADQPMGKFATRQFYKNNLGLTDAQIEMGIKSGEIPDNMTRGDAALLKKSGLNLTGLFSDQATGGTADSVTKKFKF